MRPLFVFLLALLLGPALLAQPLRAPSVPAGTLAAQGLTASGRAICISVKVFEVPELNVERRVSEEGTVNLPLIGDVPVEGLTDASSAARLKALLEAKYVQRASVAIAGARVPLAADRRPGRGQEPGQPGASPAAGRCSRRSPPPAGSPSDHGDTIYVLRRAENGLTDQIAIRVDDLLVKADPHANIPIFANDLINVPAHVRVTVFCLGEVATPARSPSAATERITLLPAIARAGGLSDRASRTSRSSAGTASRPAVEIKANYKRILSGKEPDLELADGDVVVVKESFF